MVQISSQLFSGTQFETYSALKQYTNGEVRMALPVLYSRIIAVVLSSGDSGSIRACPGVTVSLSPRYHRPSVGTQCCLLRRLRFASPLFSLCPRSSQSSSCEDATLKLPRAPYCSLHSLRLPFVRRSSRFFAAL